jgi:predicted metal-binding protein
MSPEGATLLNMVGLVVARASCLYRCLGQIPVAIASSDGLSYLVVLQRLSGGSDRSAEELT